MKPEGKYRVELDKERQLHEAETAIYFSREKDGKAVISSYDPNVIKRLLNSDFFDLRNMDSFLRRGTTVITYIDGEIPIGSVNVGKPRAANSTALVVKSPAYVYTEKEKEANRELMKKRLNGVKVDASK